ncbi:hypothetical protein WK43_03210 [Burkholderia ubonensis]|uniref:Uncharacterized protein n=1 Tax=Burkholderia ubonensis TaxID=101571 RepID=A0A107EBC9_9BURK|nr:hypothetical protein WK37_22385 [Burkholderia ubonensis]KVS51246.1 hypothetical protein WK38_13330 [Burkholderia ubonensis]KVS76249.1 hypothetical protein WK42_18970 [Burkholderia ubonensis]KVS78487.1 hypothetical protein WK43_03210 [Burkholderia ubonensis]KVS82392.1 hypothetical protein WK44_26035 [Burkholderia ubonensis]
MFFARLGAHPATLDYVQGFRTSMFAPTAVLLVCVVLSAALGPAAHRRRLRFACRASHSASSTR